MSLAWKTPHDLDLIMLNVQTNETVYWGHMESTDGNTKLNLDNMGKKNIPDEEKSHVENISFNPDVAGIYSVYVKKYPSPASGEYIRLRLLLPIISMKLGEKSRVESKQKMLSEQYLAEIFCLHQRSRRIFTQPLDSYLG